MEAVLVLAKSVSVGRTVSVFVSARDIYLFSDITPFFITDTIRKKDVYADVKPSNYFLPD